MSNMSDIELRHKTFIVFYRAYRYGRAGGDLKETGYILIRAFYRKDAVHFMRDITAFSDAWPWDTTVYPAPRSLKRVRNKEHLKELSRELPCNIQELACYEQLDLDGNFEFYCPDLASDEFWE